MGDVALLLTTLYDGWWVLTPVFMTFDEFWRLCTTVDEFWWLYTTVDEFWWLYTTVDEFVYNIHYWECEGQVSYYHDVILCHMYFNDSNAFKWCMRDDKAPDMSMFTKWRSKCLKICQHATMGTWPTEITHDPTWHNGCSWSSWHVHQIEPHRSTWVSHVIKACDLSVSLLTKHVGHIWSWPKSDDESNGREHSNRWYYVSEWYDRDVGDSHVTLLTKHVGNMKLIEISLRIKW